jgi:hypothetical protein
VEIADPVVVEVSLGNADVRSRLVTRRRFSLGRQGEFEIFDRNSNALFGLV